MKLFEDFITQARHLDAFERYYRTVLLIKKILLDCVILSTSTAYTHSYLLLICRVNRWVREVVDTCKDPLAMLHWEPDPDGVVTYGKLFLMLDER